MRHATCRHPRRLHREILAFDLGHASVIAGPADRVVAIVCACGKSMEFGPSDETPVAVEVRAADLGDAGFGDWRPIPKRREEVDGLIAYERDRGGTGDLVSRPMWHAGWLAGAIMFHDREQEEDAARAVAREVHDSIEPSGVRLKGQR